MSRVTGASGDRRDELIRRYRDAAPGGRAVWIAASPAAATEVGGRLGLAILAPGVTTPRRLADRLVKEDAEGLPLGPAARRSLIAELATSAHHRSALGPLEELAASPGLVDFLASRFRSLRREGTGADEAASALRRLDGPRAGGVLARLYRDYLEALGKHRLLDEEGVLSAAAEAVAEGRFRPGLLVVDLPVAVAPIEQRLVDRLVDAAEETLIVLPGRVGADWSVAVPEGCSVLEVAFGTALPVGLKAIRERLYDDGVEPSGETAGVAVLPGDNSQDAARRVARRVKRLLVSGKTRPDEVIVAAPRLESSAPRYAEAFAEHGIPCAIDIAPRVATAPVVGLVLDLLRVAESDWAFEPLLALVGRCDLPAFRGPSSEGFASAAAAAEWFIRETQVPSGGRYLQQQAEALASMRDASETLRRLVAAAREAVGVFERLRGALDLLPEEATPIGWLDALDAALRSLGCPGLTGATDPVDLAASETLEEAAASVEWLARWRDRKPKELRLRAAWELLEGWSTRLRLPAREPGEGRVRVVGVTTAIGLRCEHLFVVDADESAFAASEAGAAEEAMRAFWELVATPTRSLTLAYAAFDASAQPTPPSPMVTEVERLSSPEALRSGAEPLLAPIGAPARPASRREERIGATLSAVEGRGEGLARYGEPALVDALTAVHARATGDAFGPWEGVLSGDATRRLLAERYGPEKIWSVSQLELMATCPYKFFARRLLRMAPVGELTVGVDHRRRGSLMHDALAESLGEIAAELPLGRTLRDLPEADLSERLAARIDALVAARALPAYEGALLAIEARQAKDWASRYAEQQRKFEGDKRWGSLDRPLSPTLLEVRFGPAVGEDGAEDARSVDEPFELALPSGEKLRLAGRIDRIDSAPVGDQTVFAVIDYKTSRSYTSKREHIESGKQLQPVLYALAAQSLFLGESAIPVGAGYWAVRKRGYVAPSEKELPIAHIEEGHVSSSDDWLAVVEAVRDKCGELVTEVRGGAFPMDNEDEHCGSSCEFRTVCRVAQARSVGKGPFGADSAGGEGEA